MTGIYKYYKMNVLGKILFWGRKPEHRVLGRWAIDSCQKKTDIKIDLSNEDHCGPCGQYNLHVVGSPSNVGRSITSPSSVFSADGRINNTLSMNPLNVALRNKN